MLVNFMLISYISCPKYYTQLSHLGHLMSRDWILWDHYQILLVDTCTSWLQQIIFQNGLKLSLIKSVNLLCAMLPLMVLLKHSIRLYATCSRKFSQNPNGIDMKEWKKLCGHIGQHIAHQLKQHHIHLLLELKQSCHSSVKYPP